MDRICRWLFRHGGAERRRCGSAQGEGGAREVTSQPRTASAQAQRKLSFKEKHALETLPATMKKLEAEIATLESKLADPNLFTRDPKAFEQAASRLDGRARTSRKPRSNGSNSK
jgi:ABC transport system ATP-binding/permease protein